MDPGKRSRISCRLFPDVSEVAAAAARLVETAARRSIEQTGRFSLVLAGGSSPAPAYRLIASRARIDWDRVHVFWGDERCVPPDHEASNYRMAVSTLFGQGMPPAGQVHRIPGERGAAEAAALYDAELATFFRVRQPSMMSRPSFDCVLLGMGADGHTASLFPDGPELAATSWAAPVRAPDGTGPRARVTLTIPAIEAAAQVCFIVTGASKRDMVTHVLAAERSDVPAARLSARDGVIWLLDRAAGGGVSEPE